MAAKDRFHEQVRTALIQEGWTITHDPLYLEFDSTRVQIDLAGQRLLGAERGVDKIAVEVKSFLAPSTVYEFHLTVGQCLSYRMALQAQEPDRNLYLAIPGFVYKEFFNRPLAQETWREAKIKLILYQPSAEATLQWIE